MKSRTSTAPRTTTLPYTMNYVYRCAVSLLVLLLVVILPQQPVESFPLLSRTRTSILLRSKLLQQPQQPQAQPQQHQQPCMGSSSSLAPRRLQDCYFQFSLSAATPNDGDNFNRGNENKSPSSRNKESLLTAIDKAGLSLKPRAITFSEKASVTTSKGRKVLLLLQSCLYYTLFIIYRGYRGFFVILPAVFQQVYYKLRTAVDTPFVDDDEDHNTSNAKNTKIALRNNETTAADTGDKPMPWQSRLTISVLAAVLTTTYVLGGLFRVVKRLLHTIVETSNLSESFAAAADEQEINEDKIRKFTNKMKINGESSSSSTWGGGGGEDNKKKYF